MPKLKEVKPYDLPEREKKRIMQTSKYPCPHCMGPMTVGEEEIIGMCGFCNDEAFDEES